MKYAKRDTRLEGMPVLTKYQAAYRAQRRAIDRIARRATTRGAVAGGKRGIPPGAGPSPSAAEDGELSPEGSQSDRDG
jgi:hypothetical protein